MTTMAYPVERKNKSWVCIQASEGQLWEYHKEKHLLPPFTKTTQGCLILKYPAFHGLVIVLPIWEICGYFYIPLDEYVFTNFKVQMCLFVKPFPTMSRRTFTIFSTLLLQCPFLHLPPLTFKFKNPAATGCGQVRGSTGCILFHPVHLKYLHAGGRSSTTLSKQL